jgi:hypothetical protein
MVFTKASAATATLHPGPSGHMLAHARDRGTTQAMVDKLRGNPSPRPTCCQGGNSKVSRITVSLFWGVLWY